MAGVDVDGNNGPTTGWGTCLDRCAHGQDGTGVASPSVEGRKRALTLIEGQVCRAGVREVRRQSAQCTGKGVEWNMGGGGRG